MSADVAEGRNDQARVGLGLAALIVAGWLTIHVAGIFFWPRIFASAGVAAAAAVPAILLQAWLSTGLFIVAHDAMHGSLAPGRPRLNRRVGTLCLGLYAGLSYGRLHPKHHRHHRAPGTADDPDFHAREPRRLLPWFLAFFRGYYTHAQLARITVVAVAYLFLGATLPRIAAFWAVPALLALAQLFVFGTWLPHRHGDEPFADDHRARSTRVPPLVSLVTCFHFGGYHHEHHLSPGTPWWRLPAARRRLVDAGG